ncbi:MAG: hypothetical protein A3H57_00710 [Candidatus Taylorbacteria bacterium RIFCSPLOWO2_02_FULL_43_11]|uniref:Uncharacterized protein n=1 Tax=Candidatus Taylorbacteria bacterium RIFCSPHIGHO2_02_FULL_43_32b TaxID=1802306 RepID=A0A1G2MK98_9BACT|nr:MAG: hypothetical protein A2743_01615 [Candidatus Taylorbacteria bacterium RIFCSPHIGHO2_01_FULL_43_47]OHA23441.1 MAG: hypothetical protein A3C72_03705 [Candidatus Taylorbacteria bacterium RIFCSPHIGHO2_02_FULL_43_32b]OHA30457.1 MAG: hypothetical protein A3B08_02720 [Candidatus Taylorbacteria bacterium RIFCSPLOWO2_01_FULL_43_44]OHA36998.1 MAG: hypothetical protein A3H57_00710 [Candidatus Taylorbacteria bacterium RIFCSPLOWO2_02_FULL_43_11]
MKSSRSSSGPCRKSRNSSKNTPEKVVPASYLTQEEFDADLGPYDSVEPGTADRYVSQEINCGFSIRTMRFAKGQGC